MNAIHEFHTEHFCVKRKMSLGLRSPEQEKHEDEFFDMDLDQYVRHCGGKHAISRVLIANNGIAATKAIRSIKRWSYETFGRENVIEFVVMVRKL